jgi:hypothetical protein
MSTLRGAGVADTLRQIRTDTICAWTICIITPDDRRMLTPVRCAGSQAVPLHGGVKAFTGTLR